ncbi:MAG: D-alanine--D-alanine ligase [Cyclobacteriaceae bacterium]|nr:D-alanine--D-alanine ligase [Cyclobacteriaceae bacterium]
MKKIRVAILYGGRSVEHGVSINSARNIAEYIDQKKFTVIPIGITQQGAWHLTPEVTRNIRSGKRLTANLDPKHPWLSDGSRKVQFDIVFPVLHGTDGEDGSIQGFLKSLSVPLVGTGVLGSALSMNKIIAKRLLREAHIPVTDFIPLHFSDSPKPSFDEVSRKLGVPFMVKSASLGSSVGVTKVKSKSEFAKAVREAFRYDDELLFERYVQGREIECAILGNAPPKASLPGEIVISKKYDFYTFDAKYVDSKAVSIDVPAKLSKENIEQVRDLSVRAFKTLKCEDYARVDLFLSEEGEIFVNEINTIPGFTNSSMYPMMWKDRGISFTDLISRLITLAQARHQGANRIERQFNSSLAY